MLSSGHTQPDSFNMRAIVCVGIGIPSNLQISSISIKGYRLIVKEYRLSASERISGRLVRGDLVPLMGD